jgi:drug/metabolite transporter (DMT)-like permease
MISTIPHILAAVILVVVAQTLTKLGMQSFETIDMSKGLIAFYLKLFLNPYIIIGTLLYGSSVFFWLYVISKVELSFAYPFLALTYVLVILSAWLVLGETIPIMRWIGLFVICVGVILVAKSY